MVEKNIEQLHFRVTIQKGRSDLAAKKLDMFEKILTRGRGKNITEEAYQILLTDVSALKTQL